MAANLGLLGWLGLSRFGAGIAVAPVPGLGGMPPALAAMLTQQMVHAAYQTQDGYGIPSYGPPVLRPCRLEARLRTIVTTTGQERLSQHRIFFNGTFGLDVRDKLILPDATSPQILRIYAVPRLDGALDHYEVYV